MEERLDCPACGFPCQTIEPYRPTPQHPYPWWQEGDGGVCQCGADLLVDADGERAWLTARTQEADE